MCVKSVFVHIHATRRCAQQNSRGEGGGEARGMSERVALVMKPSGM